MRKQRGNYGIQWEIVEKDVDFERNFQLDKRKLVESRDFDCGIFDDLDIGNVGNFGCNVIVPINVCFPEGDGVDSEYVMFLENLREDGKSYRFEYWEGNEVKRVKYEEVEGVLGGGEMGEGFRGGVDWSLGMDESLGCRRGDLGNLGSGYSGSGKMDKSVYDEDEICPQYKMLLEKMRVKGDFYVIEGCEDYKVEYAIKDESCDDDVQLGMREELKSYYEGGNAEEDLMGCGSCGEKSKSLKSLRGVETKSPGTRRKKLGKVSCRRNVGAFTKSSGRKRKNEDDDEISPGYKMVFKNRRDEKSFVVEVSDTDEVEDDDDDDNNDEKISCRYKTFPTNRRDGKSSFVEVCERVEIEDENKENSCHKIKMKTRKTLKSSFKGQEIKKDPSKTVVRGIMNRSPRKLSLAFEKEKTKRPGNKRINLTKEGCTTIGASTNTDRKGKRVEMETVVAVGCSTKRYRSDDVHLSERTCNLKGPDGNVDGTYKTASTNKVHQSHNLSPLRKGHLGSIKSPTFKEHNEYLEHNNVSVDKKGSRFRKRLMEILSKPYNQEEYDNLMRQVSRRKLEGRGKKYGSKSLLDQHMDLVKKIDSVHSDSRQVLNLLRGFIFWLQHVTDDRSFTPWDDPICLKMIPGSESPSSIACDKAT